MSDVRGTVIPAHTGRRRTAGYWRILGAAPNCGPGDRDKARVFLARIEHAIDLGGWTKHEWRNLHHLYDRWAPRARGEDPRFDIVGNRPGRLSRDSETHVTRQRGIFKLADHIRVAQIVRTVNASDPRTSPSPATLKARRQRRARRGYQPIS